MESLILLFQLLIFSSYNSASGFQDSGTLKVGDFAYGGVVFYIDKSSQHGFVCSKEDLATGILFKDEASITDNGKKVRVNLASNLCTEYSIAEDGVLFDDWRLPTKDELFIIYQNKDIIEKTALKHGGAAFQTNPDLSPSEFCNSPSWDQEFNYGFADYEYRKMKFNVRAVRAF